VSFLTTLDRLATGGLIMLDHVQPLASKCRVEPTVSGWGVSDVGVSFNTTLQHQSVRYLSFKRTFA
jgi:hypothetical protein